MIEAGPLLSKLVALWSRYFRGARDEARTFECAS